MSTACFTSLSLQLVFEQRDCVRILGELVLLCRVFLLCWLTEYLKVTSEEFVTALNADKKNTGICVVLVKYLCCHQVFSACLQWVLKFQSGFGNHSFWFEHVGEKWESKL